MKPYYQDALITLYCGDVADVLPELPSSNFHIICTSPPYNLAGQPWPHLGNWKQGDSVGGKSKWRNGSDGAAGVQYANSTDNMPHDQYVLWQHCVLSECWRLLAENGCIFYNHKPRVIGAKLWTPLELNPDLPLRQIIIWARAGGVNFNATAYLPTHEWIMLLAKPAFRLKSRGASGAGDVWKVSQRKSEHPAPFPIEIPDTIIETTGATNIFDPFAGSGTTLVAAMKSGIPATGIEISEQYCEMAVARLHRERKG